MPINSNANTMILIILGIWLLVTNVVLFQIYGKYKRLMKGIKKKKLQDLLENIHSELTEQKTTTKELQSWFEKLEKQEENHIQKLGFVRFNPFSDTGGDQSFCLAILDGHDNGIVISSLHSRENTRLYAKSIKKSKTEGRELSKEETEAVKRAKAEK